MSPRPSSSRPRVAPSARLSLITLLTDFGSADYFVAAMKGVILSINPQAQFVDITHEIPPQDINAAAFNLLAAYGSFAADTIHLAVVDPGVGSSRRPIIVMAGNQLFVGPDNGIFSYVIDRDTSARSFQLTHLTNTKYFRQPISNTFHGRDIFAPAAAALSLGVAPEELGEEIEDPVRLPPLAAERPPDGGLRGRIIHIDRFGNCVTNLTPHDLPPRMIEQGVRLTIKGKVIREFRQFFAEEDRKEEGRNKAKLFAVWGSAGFLEIASRNRSAARLLGAKRGDSVISSQ